MGLTQEGLAKRLGNSSRASICTVEKDREDLTTTRIAKFAKALDTSPAFLMGWTDDPSPNCTITSVSIVEEGKTPKNITSKNIIHGTITGVKILDYDDDDTEISHNEKNKNDEFFESLSDEDKEFIIQLYQDYKKADPSHRLAVEALLKEKQ